MATEYLVFRKFFARELSSTSEPDSGADVAESHNVSRTTVITMVAALAGFVLAALLGLSPAVAAASVALVLSVRALARRRTTLKSLLVAANVPFCLFVLALGVLVVGVTDSGIGSQIARILPTGTSLVSLLAFAAVAAVAANALNNLPAVLLLTPLAFAAGGPVACLAVLIGVNVGPNLTYVGSLATLLWRRVLRGHHTGITVREFSTLGAITVPASLVVGTCALWFSARVLGE